MRFRLPRPQSPRRGVTLVEMLVTVTLLVLMMTALVQIFSAATGAVSAARTYQELDGSLRQLDSTIRTDLQGVTARMTPPLNPEHNLGYFEYGENQFADLQGEDTDDYVRFTARAPEGQFFTGRFYLPPSSMGSTTGFPTAPNSYYQIQPITITSQYAEIIYFLRNGNLYRRVFLIVPERQSLVQTPSYSTSTLAGYNNIPSFGITSWLGLNDISARPGNYGSSFLPILNTLGDLTNREKRAFYPRFTNDYLSISPGSNTPTTGSDGIPDEFNGDGVPDWYPTLYPLVFSASPVLLNPSITTIPTPNPTKLTDLLSFPYIFPGAYSVPDNARNTAFGAIHGMPPNGNYPVGGGTFSDSPPYGYFHLMGNAPGLLLPNVKLVTGTPVWPQVPRTNHNPLEGGTLTQPVDSLATPTATGYQTWWGFPTWKETMAFFYNDPWWSLTNTAYVQPNGLSYTSSLAFAFTAPSSPQVLPPMTGVAGSPGYQPFNDTLGLLVTPPNTTSFVSSPAVFEDDLIMTGVRSFDVKAYDDTVPGYVDLGYSNFTSGILGYTNPATSPNPSLLQVVKSVLQGFGHEGRIPPLTTDYRLDPQYPDPINGNVGDDNSGIIRLRRVFDTWSTDYTQAPASGVGSSGVVIGGGAFNPAQRPLYPSYPPPYAPFNYVTKATDDLHTDKGVPLRGLQIQIRVVDPRSQYIKVLTIRQDFTSKL